MSVVPDFVRVGFGARIEPGVIFLLPDTRTQTHDHIIEIGSGVVIRTGSMIYGPSSIGEDCAIDHLVIVREGTKIGAGTRVMNRTEVGVDCRVGMNCRLSGYLANRCTVGENTSTFGSLLHKYLRHVGGQKEPSPTVGSRVLIGWGAMVIGEVSIGDGAIVKAGSLVTKNLEPGEVFPRSQKSAVSRGE